MRLDHIDFGYGDNAIFEDFSLDIPDGCITAVLGDSGVGKTTLLHLLAGLVTPRAGQVPGARCAYMFQQPRLLPTQTVLANVRLAAPDHDEQVARHWLQAVHLQDAMALYPHQLSGGMAQRASMARAFAFGAEVLLMDEPFRGLDMALQAKLHQVFLQLWRTANPTCVLVTHDIDEALALGQRVVVLRGKPCRSVYMADVAPDNADAVRQAVRAALLAE